MPAGTLILAGLQFTDFLFAPLAGFGPGEYTLIEAGSITGSLGTSVSGTVEGRSATLAIEGNDLVLNVVPEPRRAWRFSLPLASHCWLSAVSSSVRLSGMGRAGRKESLGGSNRPDSSRTDTGSVEGRCRPCAPQCGSEQLARLVTCPGEICPPCSRLREWIPVMPRHSDVLQRIRLGGNPPRLTQTDSAASLDL